MNPRRIILFLLLALTPIAVPRAHAQEVERDADFVAGRAALEDGFYDVAARRFEAYINGTIVKRKKANGSVFLFNAWHRMGEHQKIIDWLNENAKVAANTRYEGSYFYWYAQAHYSLGKYETALGFLRTFFDRYPEDELKPFAMRLEGLALRDAGRLDEAEGVFRAYYEQFPDREEMPEHLMDWASVLLLQGNRREGAVRLEELVGRFPGHPASQRARLWLGQGALEDKRAEEAERWLRPLIDNPAGDPSLRADAWFALAASAVERGSPSNAINALAEAEVLTTNVVRRVEARIDRARLLMQLGRLDEAIQVMEQTVFTLASMPQAARAQLELSDLLRAQGRHEQAVDAYQRYLESFTDPHGLRHAQYSKAWSLWELKRYAEAAIAFEKAYDLLLNQALREQALIKSADAYFMNSQYRLAGAAYEKAVAEFDRSPSRPAAMMQAAESYARAADATNAVRLLSQVLREGGRGELGPAAQLRLARFHEEQRAWDEALAAFDDFLARFSDSDRYPEALLSRGLLRYRMRNYAGALADFERLMAEYDGTSWAERAYFMRGWCYYQMDEMEKGVGIGRTFLETFPESPWVADVSFWLAEHDFNQRRFGAAETNFANTASFHPEHALADDALYWAGRCAFEQKAFPRAIDHYGQLIRLYTNSPMIPEARFAQGDSLTEIGDFAGAILAYDEIIKSYPSSPLVVRALGRIGDCQFTLGSDRFERYQEAVSAYRAALAHPLMSADLALQTEYKLAAAYERVGRTDEALTHYLNVVYGWLSGDGAVGAPVDEVWFVRSAFGAAALKEAVRAWDEASRIYQRVVDSGVTAAADARLRLDRLAARRKADSTSPEEKRNIP